VGDANGTGAQKWYWCWIGGPGAAAVARHVSHTWWEVSYCCLSPYVSHTW
jgi:hypothetical protein